MIIPKLHYISQGETPKQHVENIQQACVSGAELVQLRLLDVSEKKVLKIAQEVYEITSKFQTRLMITDHYKIAKEIKADGVHIENSTICPLEVRKHLYTWQTVGGTANTLKECHELLDKKVNYIGLGPYNTTNTKQDAGQVLGENGYLTILEELKTPTPIIAVGGIKLEDVSALLKTGVSGIAISETITKDFNQITVFNSLLNASSTQEQRYDFK